MSKKVKIFAIIVLVIAVLIFIMSRFGGSATPTPSGSLSSTTMNTMPITNVPPAKTDEFSNLLSTVTSITIDDSILSSPVYKALRDNPVVLGTDTVGRANPFAPIGTDPATGSANPIVQTLAPGKVTTTSAEFSAQVSFTTTAPVTVIFQYGTTDQFDSATVPVVLSKSGVAVATVKNLAPNTAYRVQAVAVVGSTTTNGNTIPFTTLAGAAH